MPAVPLATIGRSLYTLLGHAHGINHDTHTLSTLNPPIEYDSLLRSIAATESTNNLSLDSD